MTRCITHFDGSCPTDEECALLPTIATEILSLVLLYLTPYNIRFRKRIRSCGTKQWLKTDEISNYVTAP